MICYDVCLTVTAIADSDWLVGDCIPMVGQAALDIFGKAFFSPLTQTAWHYLALYFNSKQT